MCRSAGSTISTSSPRRFAARVLTARSFDRMQPRVCADAQYRVLHAWHAFLEYDCQAEGAGIESDESLQILRHDGNVVQAAND
jgi:hypothetical protein